MHSCSPGGTSNRYYSAGNEFTFLIPGFYDVNPGLGAELVERHGIIKVTVSTTFNETVTVTVKMPLCPECGINRTETVRRDELLIMTFTTNSLAHSAPGSINNKGKNCNGSPRYQLMFDTQRSTIMLSPSRDFT